MRTTTTRPGPPGAVAPGRRRALVQPVAVGLLVVATFVGTYLLLLVAPVPHDVPVAVVAPPEAVAAIEDRLSAEAAAALDLRPVTDDAAAEAAVRSRDVSAAWLPARRVVLTASAAGPPTAQAVTGVLDRVAGVPLEVRDLAPLPSRDPRGLAGFYLVFGTVLAAFIFGQASHLSGRDLPLRARLGQTALVAPLAGGLAALIAGPLVGVVAVPTVLVAAVLTSLVAAVALVTQAATALLGDPGVLVATFGLLTLGNAASGGAVPVVLLPDGLRQVAEGLPPGAAIRALVDAAAFPAAPVAAPWVVLAAWCAGALGVLLLAYHRRGTPGRPLLSRSLS